MESRIVGKALGILRASGMVSHASREKLVFNFKLNISISERGRLVARVASVGNLPTLAHSPQHI